MENHHAIKFGKPSISMGHRKTMAMLVIVCSITRGQIGLRPLKTENFWDVEIRPCTMAPGDSCCREPMDGWSNLFMWYGVPEGGSEREWNSANIILYYITL